MSRILYWFLMIIQRDTGEKGFRTSYAERMSFINSFSRSINLIFLFVIISTCVRAQEDRKLLREGNKNYKAGKFSDAEINYRKALEKNKDSFVGEFNLGDALYKQGKYDESIEQFKNLTGKLKDKRTLAQAYHNLGNAYLQNKKYEESIQAFKQSLKNQPADGETKYNMAYAQAMLKKQQEQQKQQQQNKDQKQDQKKDEKKDQKQDQNKENQKDQKQDKQQAQQQPKISKEDAQRMLEALNKQEKDLQKKMGKKEAVRVSVEKDW